MAEGDASFFAFTGLELFFCFVRGCLPLDANFFDIG